jgi:hypothetical protein
VAILLEFFPKGFLDHVAGPFVFFAKWQIFATKKKSLVMRTAFTVCEKQGGKIILTFALGW